MHSVFLCVLIAFSFEIYGMELEQYPVPTRSIPSLQELCIQHAVKTIESGAMLDEFVKGNHPYSALPENIKETIAEKLPGRPQFSWKIDFSQHCETDGLINSITFHPLTEHCLVTTENGRLHSINCTSGEKQSISLLCDGKKIQSSYICCSPDGNKFLVSDHEKGHLFIGSFGDCAEEKNLHKLDFEGPVHFSPTGKEIILQLLLL